MSSLITTNEQNILNNLFEDTFDTFSRNVVIWKSPIKQPIDTSQQPQGSFGFGNAPLEEEYTYIPVSGVFPAVVRYATSRHIGEAPVLQDTNSMIPIGEVRIKVRPDCYDYIENGTTDKISSLLFAERRPLRVGAACIGHLRHFRQPVDETSRCVACVADV